MHRVRPILMWIIMTKILKEVKINHDHHPWGHNFNGSYLEKISVANENWSTWFLFLGTPMLESMFFLFSSHLFCGKLVFYFIFCRYDHFATLCELMPSGLVSLALCLRTWLNGKYENRIYEEISHKLGFTNEIPLVLYPINRYFKFWNMVRYNCHSIIIFRFLCSRPIPISQYLDFPGYQIHNGVEWFENIRAKFNFVAYSDQWVYNRLRSYLSLGLRQQKS